MDDPPSRNPTTKSDQALSDGEGLNDGEANQVPSSNIGSTESPVFPPKGQVGWENGEVTTEPLEIIAAKNPVICATSYATKEHNHLDLPGWKCSTKSLVYQARLQSFKRAPSWYTYGVKKLHNYEPAKSLDTTCWKDAVILVFLLAQGFKAFQDHGHHTKSKPPDWYFSYKMLHDIHHEFDDKHDS